MFSFNGSGNDCSDSDFSVCYDCWIPKLLENDYYARVSQNRNKKKGVNVGLESMNSLGSSGVCNSQEKGKALEVGVNGAHDVAQEKVTVTLGVKEKALNKAMDAKRAVVLASSAVGLNAMDKDGDRRGSVVDDDAQLAIRLHRVMNSSPRISRNSCLLNTHCLDVPVMNGNVDGLEFQAGGETSCSSKPTNIGVNEQNGLSTTRQECEQHCVRTQDEKCGGDFGGGLITYCRKGQTTFEAKCKEELDCFQNSCDSGWSSGDVGTKEELGCSLKTYQRRLAKVERCEVEHGHWSKTYSRRHPAISHCKNNVMYGSFNLDNGTHALAVSLKCCDESRAFTTAS
ncbi:Dothistromin biosynthesis peroxidase dotB [Bienertia sinuspersici]